VCLPKPDSAAESPMVKKSLSPVWIEGRDTKPATIENGHLGLLETLALALRSGRDGTEERVTNGPCGQLIAPTASLVVRQQPTVRYG